MKKDHNYTEQELQFLKDYLDLKHFSIEDLQILVNDYREEDPNNLKQLDRTVRECKYWIVKKVKTGPNSDDYDYKKVRRIGFKECRALLGDSYLSALDRACFHCSTSRELDDGTIIDFDNYKHF